MPYRTSSDAVRAFEDTLRRAVSCVTSGVLIQAGRQGPAQHPRALFLPRAPVPLGGQLPLALDVSHSFRVEEDPPASGTWTVRTVGYRCQLHLREGTELLAYHWHPEDPNPVKFPHLHLSAGAQVQFATLARAHVPTGLVQLHDVLRLTIEDLGVRPLRPDWSDVLSQPPL